MRPTRQEIILSLICFYYMDLGLLLSIIFRLFNIFIIFTKFTPLICWGWVYLRGRDGVINSPIKKQLTTLLTQFKDGGRKVKSRTLFFLAIVSVAIQALFISLDIQIESVSSYLFLQLELLSSLISNSNKGQRKRDSDIFQEKKCLSYL